MGTQSVYNLLIWISRTKLKCHFNDIAIHTSQSNGLLQLHVTSREIPINLSLNTKI